MYIWEGACPPGKECSMWEVAGSSVRVLVLVGGPRPSIRGVYFCKGRVLVGGCMSLWDCELKGLVLGVRGGVGGGMST